MLIFLAVVLYVYFFILYALNVSNKIVFSVYTDDPTNNSTSSFEIVDGEQDGLDRKEQNGKCFLFIYLLYSGQ